MRLLHIVEASFAGVGRHVLDLAAGQAERGHDVHVAFSPIRESSSFRNERIQLAGVEFHPVAMDRSPGPADSLSLLELHRLRRRLEPHVIHTHSTKAGLLGRMLPRSGAALVHTPNAPYSMNPLLSKRSRTAMGQLERLLGNRRSDLVFAVSPEEQAHLAAIGVEPSRTRLVPNGFDPAPIADRGEVRRELELPLGCPVIGFVGRIDHQKDPLLLIDAFDRLTGCDDAHLVLVGDGPLRPEALEKKRSSRAGERVHLVGEQPGAWSMAAFDVFALPSRYEGFPYVLLEAAAHGLPTITTHEAGASQLVVDRVSGWVIQSTDTDGLTAALFDALHDADAPMIGAELKRRAMPFTVSNMVDGVLDSLEEVLG